MGFQRIVTRKLPDGTVDKVYPFHISMEGMESVLICRDDEDHDHLQKSFYLAGYVNNALIVSDISMSTHGHCAVLARNWETASRVGEYVKKRHSQYLSHKYAERKLLVRTGLSVQYLDTDWYVRNALAYIPRNAADTGMRIEDYPWSSYRAMFVKGKCAGNIRVSALTKQDRRAFFHTHLELRDVPWLLDADGHLEPASACDYQYVEDAFLGDQSFFLRMIGGVNMAEMGQKLVRDARVWQPDSAFLSVVYDLADKWYHKDIRYLLLQQKKRMLVYLFRSYRTSVSQLARCVQLPKEEVLLALRQNGMNVK